VPNSLFSLETVIPPVRGYRHTDTIWRESHAIQNPMAPHEPQRSAVLAVRFAMRSVELRAKDRFQSAAVSVLNAYGRKRTFQDGSGRL
jgi:hypothetical protein